MSRAARERCGGWVTSLARRMQPAQVPKVGRDWAKRAAGGAVAIWCAMGRGRRAALRRTAGRALPLDVHLALVWLGAAVAVCVVEPEAGAAEADKEADRQQGGALQACAEQRDQQRRAEVEGHLAPSVRFHP